MYRKILVALENSRADESLLPHVTELAKRLHSQLLLVHVADGWVARNFEQLKLAESRSEEHTSELQSHSDLVCRLLLEKKKKKKKNKNENKKINKYEKHVK